MDIMRGAMLMAGITPDWYNPIRITLIVLISLIALFIILVVLLQPGNTEGLGAISGSSGGTDTYLGKNKGKSWESRLKKITIVAAILLVLLCIAFAVITAIEF